MNFKANELFGRQLKFECRKYVYGTETYPRQRCGLNILIWRTTVLLTQSTFPSLFSDNIKPSILLLEGKRFNE